MSRRRRLALPGIPLHVIQRGNNRSLCFRANNDYQVFLAVLAEQSVLRDCAVHAYVLMTNHVHLLVTPGGIGSGSQLMKHVGQRYTQYFNRRYKRSGTLWEGRFRSCIVESGSYFLACHRYIEMNPVRAGIVTQPHDYRWSSFGANALGKRDPLVSFHDEYLQLGLDDKQRRAIYLDLFNQQLNSSQLSQIRAASNGNFALGGAAFAANMQLSLRVRASRDRPGRPRRITLK